MPKIRVAYFTPEIAINDALKTFAGGLGFLAGDLAKAAYDFPMVAVSLLWRMGYYDQLLGDRGMEVGFRDNDYRGLLQDRGVPTHVGVCGNTTVWVKAWELDRETFKTCPVLFLDTDSDENRNDPLARNITARLYDTNERTRLAYEIILGIGGVRALKRLGLEPEIYHLNEGQTVLAAIELLAEKLRDGMSFDNSVAAVRRQVVFTTHTPEAAGNETHNIDLMIEMGCFPGLTRDQVVYLGGGDHNTFNMTVCGLLLSRKANAVSGLHATVANQMWTWINGRAPIVGILNGVSRTWENPELQDVTLANARAKKRIMKRALLAHVRQETGKRFFGKRLTAIWARRFAEYKRPELIFRNFHWLENLLRNGTIQLVFAGKPHYDDVRMIEAWNRIWRLSQDIPGLAVLPNYNLELSALLKNGADLWINTPRRPREACGTSWMSANMNLTLCLSSQDGGILEGPPENFLIKTAEPEMGASSQDYYDFEAMKCELEEAIRLFYENPNEWYARALRAKQFADEKLTSDRMLRDYDRILYSA